MTTLEISVTDLPSLIFKVKKMHFQGASVSTFPKSEGDVKILHTQLNKI